MVTLIILIAVAFLLALFMHSGDRLENFLSTFASASVLFILVAAAVKILV